MTAACVSRVISAQFGDDSSRSLVLCETSLNEGMGLGFALL